MKRVCGLVLVWLLPAVFAAGVASNLAKAASISIAPVYVQSFTEGFVSLGKLPDGGASTPAGGLLQYEFRMSLDGLQADEDFWTAIFNVNLGPGLEPVTGWMDPGTAQANGIYPDGTPSLATYDSNGQAVGGVKQHWQYGNGDFGINPDDLQSIIVEVAPDEAANRQYGEALRPAAGSPDALGSPTLIGTILVRRTETVPSTVGVSPIAGSAWGTYQGNALGSGLPVAERTPGSFSGGTVVLEVPEPGSCVLATLACLISMLSSSRARKRM